jgi:hypothetical protein
MPATKREDRRRPIAEPSEKRRMDLFLESAMNVLRKKGMSEGVQPVILAQVTLLLQKRWLKLHCAYSHR